MKRPKKREFTRRKLARKRKLTVVAAIAVCIAAVAGAAVYLMPQAEQTRGGLPIAVFRDLPPFPSDFYVIKVMVDSGKVTDMCAKINETYWKQPEFYPNYEAGYEMMLNPPKDRVGVQGYGTFPSEAIATVNPAESTAVNTCFFLKSSWFISTWQGMRLVPAYVGNISFYANSFPDGTRGVAQDSATNQQYFTITTDPVYVLLEPTWGYFFNGWVQKINVQIKVSPDTPKGKYIIGATVVAPDSAHNEEWLWQYKTAYVAIGGAGIDRPLYLIGVEVV